MNTDHKSSAGLLSNGRYSSLLTRDGNGYSKFLEYDLTRWRSDSVDDCSGFFILLRDAQLGNVWSATLMPRPVDIHESSFNVIDGLVSFTQIHKAIETHLTVFIPPHDDVEIRTLEIRNQGSETRYIEITSYLELALNSHAADLAHPAFSKLFIQTGYLPDRELLTAMRRPRSPDEFTPWMAHGLFASNHSTGELQYETDRMRFLGRGHILANARAMTVEHALSKTAGNVLDPIFSLRRVIKLGPRESQRLDFIQAAGYDRQTVIESVECFNKNPAIDQARELTMAHARETAETLEIQPNDRVHLQNLAHAVICSHPKTHSKNTENIPTKVQPDHKSRLTQYGLSGAHLLIIRVRDCIESAQIRFVRKASTFWQQLNLNVELLFLTDTLQQQAHFEELAADSGSDWRRVVLSLESLPRSDANMIFDVAACVVDGHLSQLSAGTTDRGYIREQGRYQRAVMNSNPGIPALQDDLEFDNGYGGFCRQTGEYVIRLHYDNNNEMVRPPLPWINVIANEKAGFLISESGGGYTWSGNSREHRLTPWNNDPVSDPPSEAIYIRDETADEFWSPMPDPAPGNGNYEVRHGFGYTSFDHTSQQIRQQTTHFMPRQDALRIIRLRLTNLSGKARRLSIFFYARLLLGEDVERDSRTVVTEFDQTAGVVTARNNVSEVFASNVSFAGAFRSEAVERPRFTTSRARFIGSRHTLSSPRALLEDSFLDDNDDCESMPCAALQIAVQLPASDKPVDCIFLLGDVPARESVSTLVNRYRNSASVDGALQEVRDFWTDSHAVLQVNTPSRATDLMLNGWLNYQNLSCRLWGRSAFYQSGGAYGFRDQLQDSAALIYSHAGMTRAQILLHAAHQFVEGDVLHWWHPPKDYGIRTRFSDDLLWLPYITAFYIQTTGDQDILNEVLTFVTARQLEEGEDEAFITPQVSDESTSLYDHCCRALDRSLTAGAHGLPLMGSGDWNDGMNRVGREGRGESVWLGFFLFSILESFMPICRERGDTDRVSRYQTYRNELEQALNTSGWDGAWYRRAYYDNGDPLGASSNDECRIDAIAQAWAVISKAAPEERRTQALDALEKSLISSEDGIIRLLTPAFDRTPNDPGYIKGYLPGVRENGGQYTHAAMWVIRALAEQGRGERAAALLEMLSPVTRGGTRQAVERYQTEPYVVAADVYGVQPHIGRGGWTWYTGSAAWMYRVGLESILGFSLEAGKYICMKPAVPADWKDYSIDYRNPQTHSRYCIEVSIEGDACRVTNALLDGEAVDIVNGVAKIPLSADGKEHRVQISLA